MSKNFYDYMYGGEKTAVAQDADNTYDPQNPTPGKYGLSHEDGSPCDAKTPETCPHNKKAKLVEQKKQEADTLPKDLGVSLKKGDVENILLRKMRKMGVGEMKAKMDEIKKSGWDFDLKYKDGYVENDPNQLYYNLHNKGSWPITAKVRKAKGSTEPKSVIAGPTFKSQNREEFIASVKAAKASQDPRKAWRVDVHEKYKDDDGNLQDDLTYNDCKNYATPGGSTVSVKQDGDIISVCKMMGDDIRATKLMEHAVANGGKKLDSFAGNWMFYRKCGFEPVSWTPFNKTYAPEGWQEGVDEEEPVVFFAYTGVKKKMNEEESDAEMTKWLSENAPFTGDSGYDEAMKARDAKISKE